MARTTILLGAGAAVELKHQNIKPSTSNITKESLTNDLSEIDGGGIKLLNDIYEILCNEYKLDSKKSYNVIHFEIIFHVLEMLSTFSKAQTAKYAIEAPFEKLISQLKIDYDPKNIFMAERHMLDTIWHIVRNYNDVFSDNSNDWYRDFWKSFKHTSDFFNLNYDATLEQCIDYEDGYEDIGKDFWKFNIHKLLDNKLKMHTINHLHGCIYYGRDSYVDPNTDVYDFEVHDLYKWKDLDKAYNKWLGFSCSDETTQNGQDIVQGPLITGLSKTEKTTCLPYDIYRYNFERSIIKNNSLLIVGYSFGDKYLNHMMTRMNQLHGEDKRIVLIAYWGIKDWAKDELGAALTNDNVNSSIFEQYIDLNKVSNDELLFIKRIAHHDYDIWHHFNKLSLSEPMISDNGQLMLLIGGFKESIDNHKSEILSFLNQ